MKKNSENSDAPSRMPTTLAPVSVLMRKIRNGTRGACERSSIAERPDQRHGQREQGDDLGPAPQYGARPEHPVRLRRGAANCHYGVCRCHPARSASVGVRAAARTAG